MRECAPCASSFLAASPTARSSPAPAALAHGLPLVILPAGADQFGNAGACANAGAAIELRPPDVTVDAIRSSVKAVLEEPAYGEAARRIAGEVDAMLTPAEAAAVLS
jgi:UDP:flavonoid glycosyltransferase YjiC (YdhE family)